MNSWKPFIYETNQHQIGLIAQLLHNQNITKKNRSHAKTASEIFPYLKPEIPEHLEDERVLKATRMLNSLNGIPPEIMANAKASMIKAINEEIEIEKQKPKPDRYVVSRLSGLVERASHGESQ